MVKAKKLGTSPVLANIDIFYFTVNSQLLKGISTVFTDQLSTFRVFRKMHSTLASKFATVTWLITLWGKTDREY
jgi:hypothetical protein